MCSFRLRIPGCSSAFSGSILVVSWLGLQLFLWLCEIQVIIRMYVNNINVQILPVIHLFALLHLESVSSVQLLSHVRLFVTPWTTAHQISLSITNSWSLLKFISVMPSNHLILCRTLLLLPSIIPSIRVFSNESVLRIR